MSNMNVLLIAITIFVTISWMYLLLRMSHLYLAVLSRLDKKFRYASIFDISPILSSKHLLLFLLPWFQNFENYHDKDEFDCDLLAKRNRLVFPTIMTFMLANFLLGCI